MNQVAMNILVLSFDVVLYAFLLGRQPVRI